MIYKHTCPHHLSVQQFLTKNSMTSVPHHPYSAVPPERLLFPWMKKVLKGKCFADVEKMKQKTAEVLKGIKIDEFKT